MKHPPTTYENIHIYKNNHGDTKQSKITLFADVLGITVGYIICEVIKTPKLDDAVEMLKLFRAIGEKPIRSY